MSINDNKHYYLGTFIIDTIRSKLGPSYNIDEYSQLSLTVNSNGTFEFSIDVPFIRSQRGTWEMDGSNMSSYCVFKYERTSLEDQLGTESGHFIDIKLPIAKNGKPQAEYILFDRQ